MESILDKKNSHTYCKNLLVIEQSTMHMLLGGRLVGKDHRSSPTATHKEEVKKINHALTSSHNGSPYVHAMGITYFNTSISQIHNYSTSMNLISPSPYLKTIIKYQTSHSIQHTHKKFLINLECLT